MSTSVDIRHNQRHQSDDYGLGSSTKDHVLSKKPPVFSMSTISGKAKIVAIVGTNRCVGLHWGTALFVQNDHAKAQVSLPSFFLSTEVLGEGSIVANSSVTVPNA